MPWVQRCQCSKCGLLSNGEGMWDWWEVTVTSTRCVVIRPLSDVIKQKEEEEQQRNQPVSKHKNRLAPITTLQIATRRLIEVATTAPNSGAAIRDTLQALAVWDTPPTITNPVKAAAAHYCGLECALSGIQREMRRLSVGSPDEPEQPPTTGEPNGHV